MLLKAYELWDQLGVIKRLEKTKNVYQEPRDSSHYKFVIGAYYKDVYGPKKGAIMMAVCRGKISEGLDFSDEAARAVFVIGVPYPMLVDAKTVLKRHYLDLNQRGLSGSEWYCQQATRAMNQAIGRVIRHEQDYGNIVLVDSRYAAPNLMNAISKWLRDSVRVYSDANLANSEFSKFFSDMEARGFKPKVQAISQVKLDFAEVDEDPHLREAIEDFKLQQAT